MKTNPCKKEQQAYRQPHAKKVSPLLGNDGAVLLTAVGQFTLLAKTRWYALLADWSDRALLPAPQPRKYVMPSRRQARAGTAAGFLSRGWHQDFGALVI